MKGFLGTYLVFAVAAFIACGAPARNKVYRPAKPTIEEQEWQKAHVLEKAGQMEAAATRYSELCEGAMRYSRACYDACRVLFNLTDLEGARDCAERFITEYPDNALAPAMVRTAADSYIDAGQYVTGATWLSSRAAEVPESEVWDSIQYERARLFRYADMQTAEEDALMKVVARGRWGSQLWDNAMWRMISIQRAKGNSVNEEALLLQMLSNRERSRIIASYESPYYDDALFRLGELYLQRGELQKAYDAFKRLTTWKNSRLRDDALLQCALIKRDRGDIDGACVHIKQLLGRMPDSGSVRKAKKMQEDWHCGQ